jgi:hypothetical protein
MARSSNEDSWDIVSKNCMDKKREEVILVIFGVKRNENLIQGYFYTSR